MHNIKAKPLHKQKKSIMEEKKKDKKGFTFALGIGVGIILYKIIFEVI